jgi:hypothetical protein
MICLICTKKIHFWQDRIKLVHAKCFIKICLAMIDRVENAPSIHDEIDELIARLRKR